MSARKTPIKLTGFKFADWLEKKRDKHGLSKAEWSRKIGISPQGYNYIMKGSNPRLATISTILSNLNLSWKDLFRE